MKSSQQACNGPVLFVLLLVLLLLPSHAFLAIHHSSHRSRIIRQQPRLCDVMSKSSSKTVVSFSKKDNNNVAETKKREPTRIDGDGGSPIGVAIVLLGSLIVMNGDESLRDPTSGSVGIVFATASVAAGLARLIRYLRDGDE